MRYIFTPAAFLLLLSAQAQPPLCKVTTVLSWREVTSNNACDVKTGIGRATIAQSMLNLSDDNFGCQMTCVLKLSGKCMNAAVSGEWQTTSTRGTTDTQTIEDLSQIPLGIGQNPPTTSPDDTWCCDTNGQTDILTSKLWEGTAGTGTLRLHYYAIYGCTAN